MITPVKTDKGEVQPFVHFASGKVASGVAVGSACTVDASNEKLTAATGTTRPTYIALAAYGGDVPAIRVQKDVIYESALGAASSGLKVGSKLKLDATNGTTFVLATLTGNSPDDPVAECVSYVGTASGDAIRVRFI